MRDDVGQTARRKFRLIGGGSRRCAGCVAVQSALFFQLLYMSEGICQIAQPPGLLASSAPVTFDIPSESLSQALDTYSAVTGVEVFSANGLLAGKTSTAVNGSYPPAVALGRLLANTGLVPRYIDGHSFTLVPASPQADSPSGDSGRFSNYAAVLQQALNQTLCTVATQRLIIEMWINASGTIQHPVLVEGTGDASRDAALLGLVDGLDVGVAPPADLPQPAMILIIPHVGGCPVGEGKENPP